MATLSELVKTVARVEGIDPATVGLVARIVREAGLIATSGRGASAAKMNVTDATNLLIGVNASDMARDAPLAVRTYRRLEFDAYRGLEYGPDPGTNFGDALDQLLEAAVNDSFPEQYLSCPSPPIIIKKFRERQIEVGISFYWPEPSARVVIGVSGKRSTPLINILKNITENYLKKVDEIRLDFVLPKESKSRKYIGDRYSITSIGTSTIRAVADILRLK